MSANRHPPGARQEAFDLFVAGLSHSQVRAQLRELHGAEAPSERTLKRWSVQDHWTARRARIRTLTRSHDDAQRALDGTGMIAELHKLRLRVVEAAQDLPFSSAEGALNSLAVVERVIQLHEIRSIEQFQRDRFHFALGQAGPLAQPGLAPDPAGPDPHPRGPVPPVPSEEVAPT